MINEAKERFACYGVNALSNYDLLALAIGEQEASSLLAYFGDISSIGKASPAELARAEGIGTAKAQKLYAAMQFATRARNIEKPTPTRISSSADAYKVMQPFLHGLAVEEFWLILLSRSNAVIGTKQISKGGISGTVADPKMIFSAALEAKASAIVLAHNHPSGNVRPSQADMQLTKKLKTAGEMLEITVLDHIIYTDDGYFSFIDDGVM